MIILNIRLGFTGYKWKFNYEFDIYFIESDIVLRKFVAISEKKYVPDIEDANFQDDLEEDILVNKRLVVFPPKSSWDLVSAEGAPAGEIWMKTLSLTSCVL